MTSNVKLLDPVQGLVDYVLDIKPYHTKIMEVLIENVAQENVDVAVLDTHELAIDMEYSSELFELAPCDSGFGSLTYGNPKNSPIISPNVGIAFEDYPAIDPAGLFILMGDRTDIAPNTQILISTHIEDVVVTVVAGSAGIGSFSVLGDQTTTYVNGFIFNVSGSSTNDGAFTVLASSFDGTNTVITTNETILASTENGFIKIPGNNTGVVSVLSVSYSAGTIDSWPDVTDPDTYALGDEPHTVVTISGNFNSLPVLTANQSYVAYATIDALEITGAFPYSNIDSLFEPVGPTYSQTPDEGRLVKVIQGVVTGAGTGSFDVSGDLTVSNIFVGRTFTVTTSTGNNGTYTITSLTYDDIVDVTTIGVAETVNDATVDGSVVILVPSNVFVINGDYRSRFIQGAMFDIIGSSVDGSYTVLNSKYIAAEDVTWIRTIETVDVGIDGTVGLIKYHSFGFGETSGVCEYIPGTTVHVIFQEDIKLSGLSLDLTDDVIAYNLENTDTWGFELPASTIFSSIAPPVPEQATAPLTPELNDLWFDTSVNVFKQWNGFAWVSVVRVYWHDTVNSLLYYRTKNSYDDTGWVICFPYVPGYADNIAATSQKEIVDVSGYGAAYDSTTTTEVFTLATPVPTNGSPALPDESYLKVTVNGVPAGITMSSTTEFSITSPSVNTGDHVTATVYADTGIAANAFVGSYNPVPHTVFHRFVTVDTTNDAFVVSGGNFISKFSTSRTFTGMDIDNASIVGDWTVEKFTITAVDGIAGTLTIDGNYSWLFAADRVFRVAESATNYEDFVVDSSIDVGGTTVITVTSPLVTDRIFYNPELPIISIDAATDEIVVSGDVTNEFVPSLVVAVSNSTANNNGLWTVLTSTYSAGTDQTTITTSEDILDSDVTGLAKIQSPIIQTNTWDLGTIIGAVYEPEVNPAGADAAYVTDQPKTILATSTPADATVTGITYDWIGPFQIAVDLLPNDLVTLGIDDRLGASNEAIAIASKFTIIDTDATANTFTINYVDPVTSEPIDLGGIFGPGSVITVAGSYAYDNPSSYESNDAKYVVLSTFFDWTGSPAAGTGNTVITIDTNYSSVPPYTTYNVLSVVNGTNLGTITLEGDHVNALQSFVQPIFRLNQPLVSADERLNVITVSNIELIGGNTVLTVDEFFIDDTYTGLVDLAENVYNTNVYYDEVTIPGAWVHGEIIRDVYSIEQTQENAAAAAITDDLTFGWGMTYEWEIVETNSSISTIYISTDISAVVDPNDPCSIIGSDGIDGSYEVVSATYNVGTNETAIVLANPALTTDPAGSPGINGYFRLDGIDITAWFQYLISEANATTNTLKINGDATSDVQIDQQFRVLGTAWNDGIYTAVSAPVYDSVSGLTSIPVVETLAFASSTIVGIIGTNTFRVQGNAAYNLDGEDLIFITGSTANDGTYVVESISYDSVTDTSDIVVVVGSPTLDSTADGTMQYYERGGWIESWKFEGMRLIFEDLLGTEIVEIADAAVLTSAGSLVDAFDYNFWDIGSIDETLGTVIHLYSGSFSA